VTPEDSEVVVLREHDGINDEDNVGSVDTAVIVDIGG
jgi:hypothetical protein